MTDPSSGAALVGRYADLIEQVGGVTRSTRGMRFNQLIADALEYSGIEAEVNVRGPRGEVDVGFTHDGHWYLLEAKWEAKPIDADPVRKLHDIVSERRPGCVGVLASWSGFNQSALRRAAGIRDVILLDRHHIEAIIAGVTGAEDIISAANRAISIRGDEYVPLTTMLRSRRPTPDPLTIGIPPGFTPTAVAAPEALDADVLAYGPHLRGLAANGAQLLITDDDGVIELNPQSSRIARRLLLSECTGPALADDNGGLSVVRNVGLVRHMSGEIEVLAGGYTRAPLLFAGPHGSPWLLDRSTIGSPDREEAHLVQLGTRLGEGGRFTAALPAGACRNACWMRDRTFFVLGSGHSAVIDIDTAEHRWIRTPVGQPQGLIRLNDRHVLVLGRDRHVQIAVIDTVADSHSRTTAVNLVGQVGDAVLIDESVYFVAGAPISSSDVVPVLARLGLDQLGR